MLALFTMLLDLEEEVKYEARFNGLIDLDELDEYGEPIGRWHTSNLLLK